MFYMVVLLQVETAQVVVWGVVNLWVDVWKMYGAALRLCMCCMKGMYKGDGSLIRLGAIPSMDTSPKNLVGDDIWNRYNFFICRRDKKYLVYHGWRWDFVTQTGGFWFLIFNFSIPKPRNTDTVWIKDLGLEVSQKFTLCGWESKRNIVTLCSFLLILSTSVSFLEEWGGLNFVVFFMKYSTYKELKTKSPMWHLTKRWSDDK